MQPPFSRTISDSTAFWSTSPVAVRVLLAVLVGVAMTLSFLAAGCNEDDAVRLFGEFFPDQAEPPANSVVFKRGPGYRDLALVSIEINELHREAVSEIRFDLHFDTNTVIFEGWDAGNYFEYEYAGDVTHSAQPFSGRTDSTVPDLPGTGVSIQVKREGSSVVGRTGTGLVGNMRFRAKGGGRTVLFPRQNYLLTPEGNQVSGVSWYSGVFIGFYDN